MATGSNNLFLSREEILNLLRDLGASDQHHFFQSLADSIGNEINGLQGPVVLGPVGSSPVINQVITGNPYIDGLGIQINPALIPIKVPGVGKDFPPGFDIKSVLFLKDPSGNLVDPNSADIFKVFWKGLLQNDNNFKDGNFISKFWERTNELGVPESMSELSARLVSVLEKGLLSKDLSLSTLKKYSTAGMTLRDLEELNTSGLTPQAYLSILDTIASPGIYERTQSIFISALNNKLSQLFYEKVSSGDFTCSYNELSREAWSCFKLAHEQARHSLNDEKFLNKIGVSLSKKIEMIFEDRINKKLSAGQKTHTEYGKTIRLDPKKDIVKQLAVIQAGYKPWVGKKLDELVERGLVSVAAAAIAKRNGQQLVTEQHVKAALAEIDSARKNVGKFSSTADFLKKLAGPQNEAFAKNLASHLSGNAKSRQTHMAEIEKLSSKLATFNRGQVQGKDGSTPAQVRLNAQDRRVGQAVAANALLKASGGVPSMKQVHAALIDANLSVKDARASAQTSRTFKQGLAISMARQESRTARESIQRNAEIRHQFGDKAVPGKVLFDGGSSETDTAKARDVLNKALAAIGRKFKQETPDSPAPKPTDKGPKI